MDSFAQKLKKQRYLAILLLCLTVPAAWADVLDITPFGGVRYGGEIENVESNDPNQNLDLDVDNGDFSYGVIVGIPVYQALKIELIYSHQETQLRANNGFLRPESRFADLDLDYYHVGASWEWKTGKTVHPFVAASLGVTRFEPEGDILDDDSRFSYSLGGGVRFFVMETLALTLSGRFFTTYIDSHDRNNCDDNDNYCYRYRDDDYLTQFETTLGLTFRF
ncbi:MAG: outer membrane beta-barrel protein [Gammaproteobacteria bacterium]